MQGLHHQQQQLAALLSAALPKEDSSKSSPSATTTVPATATATATTSASITTAATTAKEDESSRLSAVASLHRAIVYPPNSLLVSHSASLLFHGFSQLLSDKSYSVRQTAATAYGALCSVVSSIPIAANGRQNHVMMGGLVDRFIGWAIPLLTNVSPGDGTAELALESLREFLNVGDIGAIERYAFSILRACQELLEDERTSLSLLHRILGVLTVISLKFFRCFEPCFVDILDVLLGWAMVPDLTDSDRHVIMDSFLQFQKYWVNNMQFSLGLLSKFLGDMDALLQDGSLGNDQQFKRLLALLSCFSTVLQSTASGLLELNLLEQIHEPLCNMVQLLLRCLSMVGKKFGWSRWIEDSWRCLTLLAEILGQSFATFYPLAIDILFQSVEMCNTEQLVGVGKVTSFQVHGVLKTNLQLLSLQKLGLVSSSVCKILHFDAPISQLRLHPNHLVTGSSAATYIFLLQHENSAVVEEAVNSLIGELELLKDMLGKSSCKEDENNSVVISKSYSKPELFALIKFDLKVLLSCICLCAGGTLMGWAEIDALYLSRAEKLVSYITEKLNPFDLPIRGYVELQATAIRTLERLTTVELLSKLSVKKQNCRINSVDKADPQQLVKDDKVSIWHLEVIIKYLRKYTILFVKALHKYAPLAVKLEGLNWIYKFCEIVIDIYPSSEVMYYPCEAFGCVDVLVNLVFSVLDAALDREPKVRSHVASVLEILLQAKLVHPMLFYCVTELILEKLGDPENEIKIAFVRLLSHVLPVTMYVCGLYDCEAVSTCRHGVLRFEKASSLHWKQVFALKKLPQQLHSQQLVSILSYISQRWKVPLVSWIQRLIHNSQSSKEFALNQSEEAGSFGVNGLWMDINVDENMLERICSVNILAGVWWAIHEAARYCITTRLRTNLGGPTQTFAALERMLLDISHVLQLDTEQSDGNLSIAGSSGAHLLPMRLLLDFVEALKKNVHNAHDGSTVLPCPSRQSSLFFRANKKVCEEWFSRICEPMMNAGLVLHCHYVTIHYCTLRLQELRNSVASALKDKSRAQVTENIHNVRVRFAGDILRVLRYMTLALCKIHESEALIGLQKWATMSFSSLFIEENQSSSDNGTVGPFAWITGLVYHSEGQHEKAAAHFTHLLQNEESLSSMGSDGVQFAISLIIESHTAVADWKSLESWLLELQTLRAKHSGKSYCGALTTAGNELNSIHALARFDECEFQAAWTYLDLTPKSSSELTLDPKLSLHRSEQMLLQAMLFQIEGKVDKVCHELQKAKSMLEEPLSILPLDGIGEAAGHFSQLHCIFAFEESCKCSGSQDTQVSSLLTSYIKAVQSSMSPIRQDCNLWIKVLRVYRTIFPSSPVTLKLCKNLLTLARKQRNLLLANRLKNYLRDHVLSCSEETFHDNILSSLQYEGILLMHAENKLDDAFTNLWSFLHTCIINCSPKVLDADDNFLKAKACLKLSGWLQHYHSALGFEDIIHKICVDFSTSNNSSHGSNFPCSSDNNLGSKPRLDLIVQEIMGTATKVATLLCPTMGKSWISYASWCYDQARASFSPMHGAALKSCFFSPILASEIQHERFKLNEEEQLKVKSIVLKLFQESIGIDNLKFKTSNNGLESYEHLMNENHVKVLLHDVINSIEVAAGAPGAEDFSGELLSTTLASQLQKSFKNSSIGLEETKALSSVGDLVDVWWSLRRRRVSLFGHAAQAFIQYLSYSSSEHCDGQLTSSGGESKHKTVSYTLRATLYVLHILLNYGMELKDTLEPALSAVPLLPWQEITPQLFARLSSHSQQVVRKQLENLLVMLAKLSPSSVVYPALVDINAYEKEPSQELEQILACLKRLYPKLVRDVQLMIKELENVTVLWEELWLSTLQDLHADMMRRINLLKEEAARVAENVTLTHNEKSKINSAKYSAMMAPIVVTLERRLASTSRKPETPHEAWFQQEYEEQIRSAILNFKAPPTSAAALGDVWRPFDNIAASLASYQRKASILLGEVAPQLTILSSSDVPMPGLEKQVSISESNGGLTSQGIVKIDSFSEQILVLSTKTKPKKLVIMGSDGKKYTYLLKGREDLRLDARIMQLLQAVNGFLHSSLATRGQSVGIRYYSVTPISGRAGLIQWVDSVISIYSVFKSWQNRVQLPQTSSVGVGSMKTTVPAPVPRPSDMFYGKIIPALKEKGIRRVISRRDWPQEVKRKVLLDLMKEAPKQLLHQELWCASEGFKAFSSKMKRYSGSVATMSMVGHILGLGDRHLDNILIDFCSGDILHIDYNVCFDKGQRLKIPEIVPFRLTQTIEVALGLTGVEGTFRANCEAVLDVLKKNKDILVMLLEVFVWDPLVEWTRGDFHDDAAIFGEERRGMELAVSLSLFASRVQEIRVPLQEHHDLLLATLPAVESTLERFANVLSQYEIVSALFYRADQERSDLILHETSAKSIVAEATCNSEKTCASFQMQAREFAQAKATAAEKAQDATTWIEQHGKILDALRSSSIPEIKVCTKLAGTEEALFLISAVLVSGIPLTIVPEPSLMQCHDIDREVSQLTSELDHVLSSAVTALQAYSMALHRVLPMNYLTTSSVHSWAQVLRVSVNNLSSDILFLSRRQAAELMAKINIGEFNPVKSSYDELCLQVERYAKEIERVEEECIELENSTDPETESRAKDHLLSAFVNYMQSIGLERKENVVSFMNFGSRQERTKDARVQEGIEGKIEKVQTVLNMTISSVYNEIKCREVNIINQTTEKRNTDNRPESDLGMFFCELEEQIDKCLLIAGFVDELQQYIGGEVPSVDTDKHPSGYSFQGNWASILNSSFLSCKNLVEQMIEIVLPDVIRSVISFNSVAMDAFGSLSQIRGTIDTALEQLIEVEIERSSLVELEQNYFVKVGLITEQQLALEEAAVKGRDHLSWEEAEELASQEEACRAQLDELHQSWNEKDMRTSSLMKREANIKNVLVSSEHRFLSLINTEQESEPHILRSKALLAAVVQPFSELELIDRALSSIGEPVAPSSSGISHILDMLSSGHPISEYVWKIYGILNRHSFFIWKVSAVDSFLDSCIHDSSLSVDQNLGFDQIVNVVKEKIEIKLSEHIGQYLKGRVAPILLARLDRENEITKQMTETTRELAFDELRKDIAAVKRMQLMLEEYCNAHETVRAARSAASLMKRQVNELKEALLKTNLEIVRMEWIHDITLSPLQNNRLRSLKFLSSEDNILPLLLNLSRPKLLESIHSFVIKIAKSMESLQACERTSATAEAQLERAMGWACGSPSSSTIGNTAARNPGIPPEFHDHLIRRKQLLWEAQEKASNIIKVCLSILEFEASRDGILWNPGEPYPLRPSADGRSWQQAYFNVITKLDVSYHSFTRTEQEWKLVQSNMEAASSGLFSVSNELFTASVKAKSASDDLQSTLLAMKDGAYEASLALSAFGRVSRDHTALTSECGSMLEEVLAITEGLHDVHSLGKEAAALHFSLMENLSKANSTLLPLELLLSKDVAAMSDAMAMEKETKMEISPIHGQAIYQSYYSRIKEAFQTYKSVVPLLINSVRGLHSLLSRLARTASIHAGNLHKALEGLGESQELQSQVISSSRPDLVDDVTDYDNKDTDIFSKSDLENDEDNLGLGGLSLRDKGWISPPDSIYSSRSDSEVTSAEASISDILNDNEMMGQIPDASDKDYSEFSSRGTDFLENSYQGELESKCIVEVQNRDADSVDQHLRASASPNDVSSSVLENSKAQESDVKQGCKDALSSPSESQVEDVNCDTNFTNMVAGGRVGRGKNAYAVSILRRVEMKLDGHDIADNRKVSVAEQVDYLLKQATSVDNLCNMYEGWTPWI